MGKESKAGKSLTALMKGLEYVVYGQDAVLKMMSDRMIPAVVSDERRLFEGCLFICCPITNYNGSSSISKAIRAGASVIVTEESMYMEAVTSSGIPEKDFLGSHAPLVLFVRDSRYAMAFIYAAWFDHPAEKMITIGITGTKGKTTVAYMIFEILKKAGLKAGLIGTVEYIIGDEHLESPITTPEADILQEMLAKMAEAGTEAVVMEIASQALMTHRSQGFVFDIGVFTNIGADHIGPDECRDFEHYVQCKSLLMRQCRTGIINTDDPYADSVLEGHTCTVETYGILKGSGLQARNISYVFVDGIPGTQFDVENLHIRLPMPGEYSVSNALAAIRAAQLLSVPDAAIVDALARIRVSGRMNVIKPPVPNEQSLPTAIVDFAHNEISVKTLLQTLRIYYKGKILIVIGAVGTAIRRAPIGRACGELADLTVITCDDSGQEEPAEIMRGIENGVKETTGKYVVIPDRRKAIRYAVFAAGKDDLVVAAGRGHIRNLRVRDGIIPLPDDGELLYEAFQLLFS